MKNSPKNKFKKATSEIKSDKSNLNAWTLTPLKSLGAHARSNSAKFQSIHQLNLSN